MKSFGLFSRDANNSGVGSKQKSSEIAVPESRKRKRNGELILLIFVSLTVFVIFYCFQTVVLDAQRSMNQLIHLILNQISTKLYPVKKNFK